MSGPQDDCVWLLTQFSVHLLTPSHFINKLALEHVYIWIQLPDGKYEEKKTAIYHSLYCLAKPFDKAHVSCTYISKLDHTQFPQLTDAAVRCLRLEEELGQGHLLTSEQLPHDDHWITTFTRVKQTCNDAIKYFGEVYFIMALLLCTLTKYSAVGRHIPREDHTYIRHV